MVYVEVAVNCDAEGCERQLVWRFRNKTATTGYWEGRENLRRAGWGVASDGRQKCPSHKGKGGRPRKERS